MNAVTIAPEQTGSLSSVVSIVHDLRNPLATIHGSAEMLVRSNLSQPQVHRIARNMYCASVRMRELLEEFLGRSRGTEKKVEPSDVRELVTSAVDKIAVSAELQLVQIVQVVPEGLLITLDRHRMRRVLLNLLVNALEVMPNGGTIHISAVSDSRSVWIRVRDTGPGIPPEIRGRLFQPFATARKVSGIGLGLASSRQAVIDHGGQIWAESSRKGACFAVRLPRTVPQPPSHRNSVCPKMRRSGADMQI
ncbi:MAG TPA: HAMP domain-containing sensor histidine kinase [Bryobacteraceae bacterium]|nr:HAMP domain-containing sensor histidine kinase [Bryobacteraceae bacterium]